MSTYEVTFTDNLTATTCFTATITPAAWTARDAQELAADLARCLKPGHTVAVVAALGSRDEGVATA